MMKTKHVLWLCLANLLGWKANAEGLGKVVIEKIRVDELSLGDREYVNVRFACSLRFQYSKKRRAGREWTIETILHRTDPKHRWSTHSSALIIFGDLSEIKEPCVASRPGQFVTLTDIAFSIIGSATDWKKLTEGQVQLTLHNPCRNESGKPVGAYFLSEPLRLPPDTIERVNAWFQSLSGGPGRN
ncbi:MAG: hypothetical protein SFV18_12125 [Bryobacteraceae bacterium]|nr:hypothetical protein [Bryobacteraceae bacterium]